MQVSKQFICSPIAVFSQSRTGPTRSQSDTNVDLVYLWVYSRTKKKKKLNSVAVVRKRIIPTERPPYVGEVSANLYGYRVLRGQRNEFQRPLISVF
jgi:hypothetical protein